MPTPTLLPCYHNIRVRYSNAHAQYTRACVFLSAAKGLYVSPLADILTRALEYMRACEAKRLIFMGISGKGFMSEVPFDKRAHT